MCMVCSENAMITSEYIQNESYTVFGYKVPTLGTQEKKRYRLGIGMTSTCEKTACEI